MKAETNPANKRNEVDGRNGSKGQVAGSVPCEKKRLLIVDDDKRVRNTFQTLLGIKLPDCRIDVAVNGAEAVESFRTVHHAVLLLDIYMPVMNGVEAFGQIERECEARNWEMPSVVFCSAFFPPDTVSRIIAEKPAHCLVHKLAGNNILVETLKSRLGV